MKSKEIAIAPPVGNPPTLEWVGVQQLAVDESYQRATDGVQSRRLIRRIASAWNWNYCQPLVISRRLDGSLFVIDGQHRLSAALERGDIPHLPCVVTSGQDSASEASAFVALNTQRQRLSQADIFNAMLAASDPTAKRVAELLAETGWRPCRSPNIYKAGDLHCAPMIVKSVKRYGEPVVRNGLSALREAYPDSPVTNTATLLDALFRIYTDATDLDPDLFIETVASIPAVEWQDEGRDFRQKNRDMSRADGLVAAILHEYRETISAQSIAA